MNPPGNPPDGGQYPPPGGYGQGQWYGAPPARARNGVGIAALLLGLIALLSSWTVIGGIVFGLLALILGLIGRSRVRRGEATNGGVSLAGVLLGVLSLLIAIGLIALVVSVINSPAGRNYQQCIQQSGGNPTAVQQCISDLSRAVGGG